MYLCRAQEWRYLALLRVEVFKVDLGVKLDSKYAVEVGDGVRYWIAFWVRK